MSLKNSYFSPGRIVFGVVGWKPENGLTVIEEFDTLAEAMEGAEKYSGQNNTWAHVYEMKYINSFDATVTTKQRF